MSAAKDKTSAEDLAGEPSTDDLARFSFDEWKAYVQERLKDLPKEMAVAFASPGFELQGPFVKGETPLLRFARRPA